MTRIRGASLTRPVSQPLRASLASIAGPDFWAGLLGRIAGLDGKASWTGGHAPKRQVFAGVRQGRRSVRGFTDALAPMEPPKRKTGGSGRVTAKGTRPGDRPGARPTSSSSASSEVGASSRYTPKAQRRELVPPHWIPIIMLALLVGGSILIMLRYLAWDSNTPIVLGLVLIMGGLFTATKWR